MLRCPQHAAVLGRLLHPGHRCVLQLGRRAFMRVMPARAASTEQPQTVEPPNIRELARMAQIAVTDKEVADWEPKIAGVLEWFGALQAVDVTGVEPAVHAREEGNAMQSDVVQVYPERSALWAQVPAVEGEFVQVPKIITGADSEAAAPSGAQEAASASSGGVSELGAEELALLAGLDLRVGRILECAPHPDADALYVESIDCGDPEPRTIVSGLRQYVELEAMQGRLVVVLANLKPRNMRGIKSYGMLLAASDEPHENVEPLAPPTGALPGERIWFGDAHEQAKPLEPNQVAKKKVWETAAPGFRTDARGIAGFKGVHMQTSAGPVAAPTLRSSRIG